MRTIIPTGIRMAVGLTVASLAPPALASSIERVTAAPSQTPNITRLSCATICPPVKRDLRAATYQVPDLAPGTDRTEIREIHGEMKAVRAEAWLGGSPVTFVSKASETEIRIARGEPAIPAQPLSVIATGEAGGPALATAHTSMNLAIDRTLTTAALSSVSEATIAAPPAPLASSHEFDGQKLELRLN